MLITFLVTLNEILVYRDSVYQNSTRISTLEFRKFKTNYSFSLELQWNMYFLLKGYYEHLKPLYNGLLLILVTIIFWFMCKNYVINMKKFPSTV